MDVEDTYTITPKMINQFKYGFTRFFQNIHNATQGVTEVGSDPPWGSPICPQARQAKNSLGHISADRGLRHGIANMDR